LTCHIYRARGTLMAVALSCSNGISLTMYVCSCSRNLVYIQMFFAGCRNPTWETHQNTNTLNGRADPSTTVSACQNACVQSSGCNGVDWDSNQQQGSQCYLSGSWTTNRNNGTANGVTHYDLISCSGSNCRYLCNSRIIIVLCVTVTVNHIFNSLVLKSYQDKQLSWLNSINSKNVSVYECC